MANEISAGAPSGLVLYAVVRSSAQQPYNTAASALEAYNGANWASYALALTEQGQSGYYAGSMPSGLAAGLYNVEVRERAGGSPAASDTRVSVGRLTWTGTAEAFVLADASGRVQHDMTQAVPASNAAQTVGDALNAARAQGFGVWKIVGGTTLQLFAADGTTIVRSFTLDSATAPTQRI